MRRMRGVSMMIGVVLLGAATMSHASEPTRIQVRGEVEQTAPEVGSVTPGTTVKWDASKGRWGLRLDFGRVGQAVKDVLAGAYYRLTPSLKLGGGLGLRDTTPEASKTESRKVPQVKLEGNLSF